jgi:hypothetical protein
VALLRSEGAGSAINCEATLCTMVAEALERLF